VDELAYVWLGGGCGVVLLGGRAVFWHLRDGGEGGGSGIGNAVKTSVSVYPLTCYLSVCLPVSVNRCKILLSTYQFL
jgi:hypothetical protein